MYAQSQCIRAHLVLGDVRSGFVGSPRWAGVFRLEDTQVVILWSNFRFFGWGAVAKYLDAGFSLKFHIICQIECPSK